MATVSGSQRQCNYFLTATQSFLTVMVVQKGMEERIAMSETAIYKLEKFTSSSEPS